MDENIKRLLNERSEEALSLIAQNYSRLYKTIMREALTDESDVDECENDVLLAIWNSIPPNDPNNLAAYICTIARRVSINKFRHNSRQKRGSRYTLMLSELDECLPSSALVEQLDNDTSDDILRVLTDFMTELDVTTRVLFIRRYIYFESVKSLSERFNISENSISVRLFRARSKLRKMLEKEGISI